MLGGAGFIGRHAVAALAHSSARITIGTRAPGNAGSDTPGTRVCFEDFTTVDQWLPIAGEHDVILNCVGVLRPAGRATYERVHHLAPKALAQACALNGTRLVHVSALGLADGDRSGFLTSKRRGEQAIIACGGDWVICRPSLLDGDGGYGAAWLRGVARLPVFAVPADAHGRIAALTATDLGEALAQLCLGSAETLGLASSREFEVGGTQCYDFEAYIHGLRRRYSTRRAVAVRVPGLLARLGAHVCDLFRFTPFSFGHWELLRKDNVPRANRLPELLGRPPTAVIAPDDAVA